MNLSPVIVLALLTSASAAPPDVIFRKRVIDPEFRAEACAAADINRDSRLDVVAGESWYEAPGWKPHRFRTVAKMDGYADVRCDHPADVNRDGWIDIVSVRRTSALVWFENPKGTDAPWTQHQVGESPKSEGVVFGDVNGDGIGDFVGPTEPHGAGVAWWNGSSDSAGPWKRTRIGSAGGDAHGIGIGDLNHDGRNDVLTRFGWYEAPPDPYTPDWPFHHADRGQTHHSVVHDFDGDGDQDIAASSPHDYGLYWWQRSTAADGRPAWTRQLIDDTISQLHDLVGADVDGDGDTDLITGKRFNAHHGKDPGAQEPAALVWYELQRDRYQTRFIRHDVDHGSGVGYVVTPVDIDGDGDLDILTANQKGVFLFEQLGTPEFLPLFNGKDLDNWTGDKGPWSVEDGVMVGKTTGLKHNNFVISKAEYDNFVLTLDVKLVPDKANSGIQFRSTPREHGEVEGYQADVGGGGRGWWGSIYEELGRGLLHDGYKGRGEKAVVKGDWNHYVIYAVGDELRVEINGTVCTHLEDDRRKTGVIALQIHSGGPTDVRFRNIRMRKVK